MKLNEFQLIEKIRKKIPRRLQGDIGIGDDAAVFDGHSGKWLLTADIITDRIDFHYAKTKPEDVGRKALAINLSDIAAMGGVPVACVVSLGLPRMVSSRWVERFYAGLSALASRYDTLCVGGDISASRVLFISVALLGKVRRGQIIKRAGCRIGDVIGVTGRLGGSIRGRHVSFQPRVREAQFLTGRFRPTAMIDLSDGLFQDLGHLLNRSYVSAEIDLSRIPISKTARIMSKNDRKSALRHALTDGEDFELLFTISSRRQAALSRAWKKKFPDVPLTWLGKIRKGKPQVRWMDQGKPIRLRWKRKGYAHF